MKNHYTNITEAMAIERPYDKIIKVLSNKFCIGHIAQTDGTYFTLQGRSVYDVFGLGSDTTVYGYGHMNNIQEHIEHVLSYPNTDGSFVCYNHSANGHPYHYLRKISDNRKWKQNYRKLKKLLL